jgi:cell division protease FtsH
VAERDATPKDENRRSTDVHDQAGRSAVVGREPAGSGSVIDPGFIINDTEVVNTATDVNDADANGAGDGAPEGRGQNMTTEDKGGTSRWLRWVRGPQREQGRPGTPGEPSSGAPRRSPTNWIVVAGVLTGLLLFNALGASSPKRITIEQARTLLDGGNVPAEVVAEGVRVERASMDAAGNELVLELGDGTKRVTGFPDSYADELLDTAEANGIEVVITGRTEPNPVFSLLATLLPVALIMGVIVWSMRRMGGGAMKVGRSQREKVEIPTTRFADVAGVDEAVEDLREVVEFLRDPDRFERLGARTPRGVLLAGPPGTGKTLLARATAGEAGVSFYALSGSDFVEMFVGVGASRVRSAFEKARKDGRAIVFIDEIDAIGKARGNRSTTNSNDERENTLNALLVEMDGFERSGVVVVAATNRADVLDEALLRPGRFDRRVMVAPPDRKGREQLFGMYLGRTTLDAGLDVASAAASMAARSIGMTGADVAVVVNEAALAAAKEGAAGVGREHLDDALERLALGRARRSREVSEQAQRITAWHEAGHTVCSLAVPGALRPERVSIVPRGGAGGATWFAGDDESFVTRSQAMAALVATLGGRAAEERLLDGDVTQGASGDLKQATGRAERMVCDWGMTGTLAAVRREQLLGDGGAVIRGRVEDVLQASMSFARVLLERHETLLAAVAEALLEHETLSREDLEGIVAKVSDDGHPVRSDDEFRQFVNDTFASFHAGEASQHDS